jgi:hypothetical protein
VRPAPGGSRGLGNGNIGFDSTVSEDAAQATEFAAVNQVEHRILPDFSGPAMREVGPSAANCSTSLTVVVLTTRTISMKAAAFFVEALLARARRTPGGRSARVLGQDGVRGLSPRIGSQ